MTSLRGHINIRRKAKDGTPGAAGKSVRNTVWATGKQYYAGDTQVDGVYPLDIVSDKAMAIGTSGVNFYMCIRSHTSSSGILLTNTSYWSKLNNLKPVVTYLILAEAIKAAFIDVADLAADNAFINNLHVKHLTAADGTFTGEVQIYSGETLIANIGNTTWPLWIGASTAALAPYKVNAAGKVFSAGAEFSQPVIQNDVFSSIINDFGKENVDCSPDYILLDGANYRFFLIDRNAPIYVDAPAYPNVQDYFKSTFEFRFKNLVVGVVYTVSFKIKHQAGQEYTHTHSSEDWYDGYSYLGSVVLKIKDQDRNIEYVDKTSEWSQSSWSIQTHGDFINMIAQIDAYNGQICTFQFMLTSSNEIRLLSYNAQWINFSYRYR